MRLTSRGMARPGAGDFSRFGQRADRMRRAQGASCPVALRCPTSSSVACKEWPAMSLTNQRELFEIPDQITYLNCAYMSPLLRAAREAGQVAIARKSTPWRIAARDFFEDSETARRLFAELISADADGVALIPAASYGLSLAAANLPMRPGQR